MKKKSIRTRDVIDMISRIRYRCKSSFTCTCKWWYDKYSQNNSKLIKSFLLTYFDWQLLWVEDISGDHIIKKKFYIQLFNLFLTHFWKNFKKCLFKSFNLQIREKKSSGWQVSIATIVTNKLFSNVMQEIAGRYITCVRVEK